MRIGHIELFCRDTEASRAFFVDQLGFELVVSQPGGFIWTKAGEMEILLRPTDQVQTPVAKYGDAASAIVLYTDDLDSERRRIEQNGVSILGTDGSDDCLTFTDPDGHWFQLVAH